MRFVALALILISLPLFVAWLQSNQKNRDFAMTLFGLTIFVTGSLQIDAAIVSWPLWTGTSRGLVVSPADMLALAMLFTRKRTGPGLPLKGLMFGYLAVLALSVAYSRVPMASVFSVWDFGRAILTFFAVGGELARPTAYPALVRGFSLGLMIQAGYVIQQKLSGVVQATGTLVHQNQLGIITELVFLNLVAALLEGERRWVVILGALAGAIIVAGGGSRGAIAVMGAACVVLILLSLIRSQTSGKFAMAGAAAFLILVTAPIAMMTLEDRFGGQSVTMVEEQRGNMEEAARAMSADHPFGVGANLYTTVSNVDHYAERANVAWSAGNRSVPVHNSYLLARAETGYHGEAMLVLLLVVPIIAGLRHAFRYKRGGPDGWTLGAATALGALAVHSNFEFGALVYTSLLPLAINIAIVAGRIRAKRIELAERRADGDVPDEGGLRRKPLVARMPEASSMQIAGRREANHAHGGPSRRGSQEARS